MNKIIYVYKIIYVFLLKYILIHREKVNANPPQKNK